LDVGADDWAEEMGNEDEMEGVAGPDRPTTPTPTQARWATPTPAPVSPTRGSKRMAMGTPRPTRHYRPAAMRVGLAAASALEQILAAIAEVERKVEKKVALLDGKMLEGMAAMVADANGRTAKLLADAEEREKRMSATLLADAEEREKRLAVKLLATEAIEKELAQRAQWEGKQWEDLAGVMGLRREDIREVKQAVDNIAAEMAGIRAKRLAPEPARLRAAPDQAAPARLGRAVPEAMEGVVATAPVPANMPRDDLIEDWEDMEGVEPEGLYTSHHAPELGAPTGATLDAPKRKKEKGKAKEVQVAVPPAATPTPGRKPKDPPASSKGRRWWKGR